LPAIARPDKAIYKIVSEPMWRQAEESGYFTGSSVDARDGFIHFSTAAQVRETAARHFSGVTGLLLVAVRTAAVKGAELRWEPSRGGDLFPHLYADLPMKAVMWAKPLPLDAERRHVFPDLDHA
jgi:uncharacterized protein (DUF952 family)